MVGFPANVHSFHELSDATARFRKLIVWDRVKSLDAAVVFRVKIDALKDIPASILVSGAKNSSGQSWTWPVIILEDMPIGNPPPDKDPVPKNDNPHPRP